jgi:competence protein ComEA
MRKAFLTSLVFAFLASTSAIVSAAPVASAAPPAAMTAPAAPAAGMVNLNTADAETLKRELSGIGLAKAEAIVKHRETNGEFLTVDELLEVKGIGKSLLDRNRDKLALK